VIGDATTYYGELMHERVAGPFVVTESLFRAGATLPTHSHGAPYFTFTLKGSYQEHYDRRTRSCTPGTAVGHPAHETHSQVFDREPALLIRVAFGDRATAGVEALDVARPAALRNPLLARTAWRLHRELRSADAYTEMIVEGLAYELAGQTLRGSGTSGGSRRRALQAQTLLRSSLRRRTSLGSIAAQLGVSRATLYRDFTSAFCCSPGEYLRRTRIDQAAAALANERRPIADIAADYGFYDQSHFDRVFRSTLGMTPTEYRRSVR
jgi:AraC family transcriptional regulator